MEEADRSDTDVSYDLDRRVIDAYDPKKLFRTVEELQEIGVVDVFDGGHEISGMHNTDFSRSLRRTRQWIEWLALKHAKKGKIPENIDYLLKDDNITEDAHRFKWRGLYLIKDASVEDKDRYNEEVYPVFSERWEKEKKEVFTRLFSQYRAEISAGADVSDKIAELQQSVEGMKTELNAHMGKRRWPLYVGGAALFLLGAVAAIVGAYELYLKPDIKKETKVTVRSEIGDVKKEVKEMIPNVPTLDDMVDRLLPVVKKEFEMYENRSANNVEMAINRTLVKLGIDMTSLKERLVQEMMKELKKEMEQKKEEEHKNPEAKESDF